MSKGSARTLKYWLDKGYKGEEAERMRLSRTPGTLEYFMIFKKMNEDDAKKAKEQYHGKRKNTYENFIKKHGEIEGEIKWQLYKDRQAYSNSFEYKLDKYGWNLDQYNEYNKNRNKIITNINENWISDSELDRIKLRFKNRQKLYGWPDEWLKLYIEADDKMVGQFNHQLNKAYYDGWVNQFGKRKADEMEQKYHDNRSNAKLGEKNGCYGRPRPASEIKQISDSVIKYMKLMVKSNKVFSPAYNINSIPIIEQYGKDNGYNFQHAENGGEYSPPNTSFFVDAYDTEKNVVLEYNERYHTRPGVSEHDKIRQDIIGKLLKCKFIRINHKNEITEYDYKED